jgi:hypothetical protein
MCMDDEGVVMCAQGLSGGAFLATVAGTMVSREIARERVCEA